MARMIALGAGSALLVAGAVGEQSNEAGLLCLASLTLALCRDGAYF